MRRAARTAAGSRCSAFTACARTGLPRGAACRPCACIARGVGSVLQCAEIGRNAGGHAMVLEVRRIPKVHALIDCWAIGSEVKVLSRNIHEVRVGDGFADSKRDAEILRAIGSEEQIVIVRGARLIGHVALDEVHDIVADNQIVGTGGARKAEYGSVAEQIDVGIVLNAQILDIHTERAAVVEPAQASRIEHEIVRDYVVVVLVPGGAADLMAYPIGSSPSDSIARRACEHGS